MPSIEHVFILMLENRSFDHVFGFSDITGVDAITGQPTKIQGVGKGANNPDPETGASIDAKTPADFSLKGIDIDPGHEFADVLVQLSDLADPSYPDLSTHGYPPINNQGFIRSYKQCGSATAERIMSCFSPEQLPVLNALAREFAVCDNWFSSLPGPTWPNRFFMMAASSGGLVLSPSPGEIVEATLFEGYGFEHGNIFDALNEKKIPWVIFQGDKFPVSFALKGMDKNARQGRFIDFSDFDKKLNTGTFSSKFIFIEPKYGKHTFDVTGPGDFSGGNSMHPLDDIRQGEALVKQVYESIRRSSIWEKSVLIIVFDEHGGFYDHVTPPAAVPPGDLPLNASAADVGQFKFDQLGVRVPALVISPWIEKGVIDHTLYDHSSALATVEKLFGLQPLSRRDGEANHLLHLFSLENPRTVEPILFSDTVNLESRATLPAIDPQETEASLRADLVTLQARSLVRGGLGSNPVATHSQVGFAYVALLKVLNQSEASLHQKWKDEFRNIQTNEDAARFMTKAKLKVYYGIDPVV